MTIGVRQDDLRRRNRAMVIAAVRRAGQPSRTEIAAATGLSHSTISAIASDLIAERVLAAKPAGAGAQRRGRPQVALGLDPSAANVAVVALSLKFLSFTLFDYAGGIALHRERRLSTLDIGRDELLALVRNGVRTLVAEARAPVMRITMAVQGITDAAGRKLLWSPITPHGDIAFADLLEAAADAPAGVENDCNMIAVALKSRAPESAGDNLIAVLLSNGIGMGMMLSGELFVGAHSSGGEFGHMTHVPGGARCRCGRDGCVEAYAGNYAILRNARGDDEHGTPLPDIDEATMAALAAAARDHDGPERAAFARAGEALGYGFGSLFALIDPAPITIVGGGAAAFDLIEPALREAYTRTAGGIHGPPLAFSLEIDEAPLIREGCAVRGLALIDDVFARGVPAPLAETA